MQHVATVGLGIVVAAALGVVCVLVADAAGLSERWLVGGAAGGVAGAVAALIARRKAR
jgi:hypothetical protein